MSQITIVDHVLNFTEIAAAPPAGLPEPDAGALDGDEENPSISEERRISRELTSILISGHLSQQ
jgi:hypothetical protein